MQPRPSDIDHLTWLKNTGLISFSGKKILDLGCGSGFICTHATSEKADFVAGVDIEKPEMPVYGWHFLQVNLDQDNWHKELASHKFDFIFAFDILEHLESPYKFLCSCQKLLSEEGTLFLTTPNVGSWERLLKPITWSGARDPQHKILLSKYGLNFLLERSGFKNNKLSAPVRSLAFLGQLQPDIGGQFFVVSRP